MTLAPQEDLLDRREPGSRKASRRNILRAALRCFDNKGIEATSIDLIRELSGSSVGTIYHHFGSKEGIVSYLYQLALTDQSEGMQAGLDFSRSSEDGVKSLVTNYMRWVQSNPSEARLLYRGRYLAIQGDNQGKLAQMNRNRFEFLMDWIKAQIAAGHMGAFPPEIYPSLLIGQAENYCRSWLSGRVKSKPEVVSGQIAQATWRSVASWPS